MFNHSKNNPTNQPSIYSILCNIRRRGPNVRLYIYILQCEHISTNHILYNMSWHLRGRGCSSDESTPKSFAHGQQKVGGKSFLRTSPFSGERLTVPNRKRARGQGQGQGGGGGNAAENAFHGEKKEPVLSVGTYLSMI